MSENVNINIDGGTEDEGDDGPSRYDKAKSELKSAALYVKKRIVLWTICGLIILPSALGTLEMLAMGDMVAGLIGREFLVPPHLKAESIVAAQTTYLFLLPSILLYSVLRSRQGVDLEANAPPSESNDKAVWELEQPRWADLDVVDKNGEEVGKSALIELNTMFGRKTMEVDDYDPETNTAVAPWFSNASLRGYEKSLQMLQTEMRVMADMGLDTAINETNIIRKIARKVVQYLMRQHNKATIPNGEIVNEVMDDVLGDDQYNYSNIEDKMRHKVLQRMDDDIDMSQIPSRFRPAEGDNNE